MRWSPPPAIVYLTLAGGATVVMAYRSFVLVERPVLAAVRRAVGSTRPDAAIRIRPSWRVRVDARWHRVGPWCDAVEAGGGAAR